MQTTNLISAAVSADISSILLQLMIIALLKVVTLLIQMNPIIALQITTIILQVPIILQIVATTILKIVTATIPRMATAAIPQMVTITPLHTTKAMFPPQPKTNSFALVSLILGIVSLPLMCCCVGVITAILAIIFGFIAKNKIAASNGYETGNGMALAGIIIGFAVIGIAIILVIVSIANGGSSGNFWEQFNNSFQEEFQKQLEKQNQVH